MTWNEQANSMLKVWTEAQKTMWESWYTTLQNISTPTGISGGGVLEQWQKLAAQGLQNWTGSAEPTAKNVSRQLVAAQSTMMQFLDMTTKAWSIMMPKLDAGQDWPNVLSNYIEEFRKQAGNPAQFAQISQDIGSVWLTALQQSQTLGQPWVKLWQQTPGLLGAAAAGEGATAVIDLNRTYWDAYNQTVAKFVGSPSTGFTRELEKKFARGAAISAKLQQASQDYNLLVADAWSGIYEQVLKDMMKRAEEGKPIESIRDLVRLWTTAADQSFDKVFRDPKYAEVQGRFVSSYMEYRISEQEIVEEFLKYSHIPTRSEVDEAHRNIHDLRKEVKVLKKALNFKKPAEAHHQEHHAEANTEANASSSAAKTIARSTVRATKKSSGSSTSTRKKSSSSVDSKS